MSKAGTPKSETKKRKSISVTQSAGRPKKPRLTLKTKMAAQQANLDTTGESQSTPIEGNDASSNSEPLSTPTGAKQMDKSYTVPPALAELITGLTQTLATHQSQMKTSMAEGFVTLGGQMTDQMKEQSAAIDVRLDTKFTEYEAAMGLITANSTSIKQSVTQLTETVESNKTFTDTQLHANLLAMDTKFDDHAKATEAKFVEQQRQIAEQFEDLKNQLITGAPKPQPTARRILSPRRTITTSLSFDSEIIIDGIEEGRNENTRTLQQECEERVFSVLGLDFGDANIESCSRLGREFDAPKEDRGVKSRPRSVLVKFRYTACKDVCLRRSYKLRGHHLFINEHYSPAVERRRKRLYPILRKARSLSYDDRISLVEDKIVLDGSEIGVNELYKLPAEIHPRDIATEKRGDVTFFFRQDSPLSNHHTCEFTLDGVKYNCSEQAYFHKKAIMCGDDKAKSSIMRTKSPGIQKSIGEGIKTNTDWERNRVSVMTRVCKEKFAQNPTLREFLDNTSPTYLAEDNPGDSFWGIALSRNSPRAANRMNFKDNNMGIILMQIRDGEV
jgi:hypothetical protein